MNCVLFAKMDKVFSFKKNIKRILEKWKKYWKSRNFVSPEKWEPSVLLSSHSLCLRIVYSRSLLLLWEDRGAAPSMSQVIRVGTSSNSHSTVLLRVKPTLSSRVSTRTGKPGKWEGIFQSEKSQGKSHKIMEISDKCYLLFLVIFI